MIGSRGGRFLVNDVPLYGGCRMLLEPAAWYCSAPLLLRSHTGTYPAGS